MTKTIIAIGDIHGRYDKLCALRDEIKAYTAGESNDKFQLVFLGDYVDRGPQSKEVCDAVMKMQEHGAIALRGNHEQMMIDSKWGGDDWRMWSRNGGDASLVSFGNDWSEYAAWAATLPLFYETTNHFFVHAGVNPKYSLEHQVNEDLIWIRSPFLNCEEDFGKYIVHGHTPTMYENQRREGRLDNWAPVIKENRINIDTGAVFGGQLTAAVFDPAIRKPIKIIGV